jgi:16S rRNA (uracil1498-N3)-methyltransferase
MREPRLYLDQELQCDQTISLPDEQIHHVSRVLRMRSGQRMWLFNGNGGSYLAEIVLINKRQLEVRLLEFSDQDCESGLQITLLQGISRSQHMDYTLQKAVELGVKKIVPLITEFSNVQLDQNKTEKKLLHWQKIIINACEQCGRTILPLISIPVPFAQALEEEGNPSKFLLQPGSAQHLSKQTCADNALSLLSGPEGGFSQTEVEHAIDKGFIAIELGPRVLRTETAAVAAISACQVLWGDMA